MIEFILWSLEFQPSVRLYLRCFHSILQVNARPLAFIHPVKLRHQTKSPREHPQNEFFIRSRAPPLQHAALLITVLISVGFPRAEE